MPVRVIHYTSECEQDEDFKRLRRLDEIEGVLFHRTGGGENSVEIAKKFREDPDYYKWTKSRRMPYTFVIRTNGQIEQALRLTIRAPHAGIFNTRRVSVGVCGDFRKNNATRLQEEAAMWLGRHLSQMFLPAIFADGHTDLPGASSDPDKVCPGKKFGMHYLRGRMLAAIQKESRDMLRKAGVLFGDE